MGLKNAPEVEFKIFHEIVIAYASLWSSECPIMISTTNRYTVISFEAAVVAKRNIRKGELLQHLCGLFGGTKATADRLLLFGPIRFVNHDCKANAEFFRTGDGQKVIIRALQAIGKGEEITANYGSDYFSLDYSQCLCGSCEIRSLGGWKGEDLKNQFTRDASRRSAPDRSSSSYHLSILVLMRNSAINY